VRKRIPSLVIHRTHRTAANAHGDDALVTAVAAAADEVAPDPVYMRLVCESNPIPKTLPTLPAQRKRPIAAKLVACRIVQFGNNANAKFCCPENAHNVHADFHRSESIRLNVHGCLFWIPSVNFIDKTVDVYRLLA
jgi:hypothetical protein